MTLKERNRAKKLGETVCARADAAQQQETNFLFKISCRLIRNESGGKCRKVSARLLLRRLDGEDRWFRGARIHGLIWRLWLDTPETTQADILKGHRCSCKKH